MKTCKQCGESKHLTAFRTYYNGGSARNNTCKVCEKINSRRKYLESKDGIQEHELSELKMIYQLYDEQRKNGLKPPRKTTKECGVVSMVSSMIHKQQDIGAELQAWLTCELSDYKPEQLDEVYNGLAKKYRPICGLDTVTKLPIYNNTYKEILDKVLVRFDDYEEAYYGTEQG